MESAPLERPRDEQPVERWVTVNGQDLCLFEWGGDAPTVLLAHATGFHARTWDAVARLLPGLHLLAVDLRGHGRSSKPEPPFTWLDFGKDIAALVDALDLRGVVGVGHSMGGHCVTYAAAHGPGRFASLLLVDPVLRTDGTRPAAGDDGRGGASFVAKRRNRWASPEEMVERFRDRFPYSRWRADVLDDYARYGLLPDASGEGYVLACPPHIEAALYGMAAGVSLPEEVAAIDVPVRVLRARVPEPGAPPFSGSPTSPDLASKFTHGEDVPLPDLSHFIPMEAPALVARHIRELAGDQRRRAAPR